VHLYYGHFAVLATQRSLDDDRAGRHPLFWHPSAQ
jgi:hypothetical protein